MKIVIVMPAYNEGQMVGKVISDVKRFGFENILVVDDGSSDNTFEAANEAGAKVIKHVINRGLGGALGTGIKGALKLGADIIVTVDSDGQHAADDIKAVIEPLIRRKCDIVIGTRIYDKKGMPFMGRLFNRIGNLVTEMLFGVKVTDKKNLS